MLPTPLFSTPPEPFQTFGETVCDPVERPGVHAFLKFVITHQGGQIGRTLGLCGGVSGHASGRAWDWMIRADVPSEKQRADELIDWLLANDAELFRRAGLSYIIWNKRSWSAFNRRWKPYDGYAGDGSCTLPEGCRDPHVSHVHFSFTEAGADGKTSFYDWLTGGEPERPPVPPAIPLSTSAWPAVIGAVLGCTGVIALGRSRWWAKASRRLPW